MQTLHRRPFGKTGIDVAELPYNIYNRDLCENDGPDLLKMAYCGECTPWCEYKLEIPELLQEAHTALTAG